MIFNRSSASSMVLNRNQHNGNDRTLLIRCSIGYNPAILNDIEGNICELILWVWNPLTSMIFNGASVIGFH